MSAGSSFPRPLLLLTVEQNLLMHSRCYISEGGVVGGCADLCSALASKTSPAIGTVCNILCDIAGIEEFIRIVQK